MPEISVQVDQRFASQVDGDCLAGIARRVLQIEKADEAELDILITDDETVRRLNREYAQEDKVTDVLSFSLQEGEPFAAPADAPLRLGEVIIAYPFAMRQAEQAGRPGEQELAHLLIHGILHLLGYDHAEPEEERIMRGKEAALLEAAL